LAKHLVDPPGGWRYGFPKVYDSGLEITLRDWLVVEGYPKHEIDKLGKHFYVKMQPVEAEDGK
jgi:hypothetical protein